MCRSDSKVQDGVSGGFWGWRAGRDGGAGRVGAVRLPCKTLFLVLFRLLDCVCYLFKTIRPS